MLGGFGVTVDGVAVPPEAWPRRHAAALVKLLALTEGRRLHREQVTEALWPGLDLEPPPAAAQGGPLRAQGRWATARSSSRNDMVMLVPDDEVRRRRRPVPAPPRGRRCPSRLGVGGGGRAGGVHRAAAAGRPVRGVDARGPRADRDPAAPAAAPGRPVAGAAGARARRRGGPRRAGERAPGGGATRARRCASSSGWSRRCAASWAPRPAAGGRPPRSCGVTAGVRRRAAGARGAARRPSGGSPRRGGRDPSGASTPRRAGRGAHCRAAGSRRGGQVGAPRHGRGPGAHDAAGAPGGDGVGGGGPVALRPRARGVGRPVPQAPGAARRSRRRLPRWRSSARSPARRSDGAGSRHTSDSSSRLPSWCGSPPPGTG